MSINRKNPKAKRIQKVSAESTSKALVVTARVWDQIPPSPRRES